MSEGNSGNTAIVAIVVLVIAALGLLYYFGAFGAREGTGSSTTTIIEKPSVIETPSRVNPR